MLEENEAIPQYYPRRQDPSRTPRQTLAWSLTPSDLLWNYPTGTDFQTWHCTFYGRGLINHLLFRRKPWCWRTWLFFPPSCPLWLEIIGSVTGSNQKWQSLGYKAFASSLTIPPPPPAKQNLNLNNEVTKWFAFKVENPSIFFLLKQKKKCLTILVQ